MPRVRENRCAMATFGRVRPRGSAVNVGPVQRGASVVAGGTLLALGLRRRTLRGTLVALAGADLLYRGATGYCHALAALGIGTANRDSGRGARADAVEIQRSITVQRSRDEVYRRWRDPQSQRRLWTHFAEITDSTDESAHWRVHAPLGRTLEWETRIAEERASALIRWESTGGDLPNEGTVEFRDAPGELGTEITLRVRFDPPAGVLGGATTRLLDDPPKLVLAKTLRRFKSLVESGEIPSTDSNPSARER